MIVLHGAIMFRLWSNSYGIFITCQKIQHNVIWIQTSDTTASILNLRYVTQPIVCHVPFDNFLELKENMVTQIFPELYPKCVMLER